LDPTGQGPSVSALYIHYAVVSDDLAIEDSSIMKAELLVFQIAGFVFQEPEDGVADGI